ncbi:MAG: SbcC/MukB-like Walker B domain-containing protein, partial [Bacteroidota bacterium]|nr:SbcC/MukB-like Walker B domain-containing protein [Bacteroidota bacterium]
ITGKLKEFGHQTSKEVEQILNKPYDLEKERETINRFRQELFNAGEQYKSSLKEAEGRQYDPKAHEVLLQELKTLSEEVEQKNQKAGSLQNEIKVLNENLAQAVRLKKDLEKLETRAENLRTLKLLFKGSGFVNYVSSVYLQNLCSEANRRFSKLTCGKLRLELTANNNFLVRDFMNEGKLRSVKTLSGGQTFQAALSLALALADNIRQITESSQNFFFLDEGFGSLDKESLAVVFETLKSLRKERRIVGVISHVEEMQQEIDTHLKIVNDPDLGSIINPSWRN